MKKAIVFGIGNIFYKDRKIIESRYEIIGYYDNDAEKCVEGEPIPKIALDELKISGCEILIITPKVYWVMAKQALNAGVPLGSIYIWVKQDFLSPMDVDINSFYQRYHAASTCGVKYWGQHGEDLILTTIFKMLNIEHPTYFDLGAHQPYFASNSAFLYLSGSRGINVEPNPSLYSLFVRERPEDINLNAGVGVIQGVLPFYRFSEKSQRNTFDENEAQEVLKSGLYPKVMDVIDIPVYTIDYIVNTYFDGNYPDFIDIDVEGMDCDILKSMTLTDCEGPKVIMAEIRKDDFEAMNMVMNEKGYTLYCRMWTNNIYIRTDCMRFIDCNYR